MVYHITHFAPWFPLFNAWYMQEKLHHRFRSDRRPKQKCGLLIEKLKVQMWEALLHWCIFGWVVANLQPSKTKITRITSSINHDTLLLLMLVQRPGICSSSDIQVFYCFSLVNNKKIIITPTEGFTVPYVLYRRDKKSKSKGEFDLIPECWCLFVLRVFVRGLSTFYCIHNPYKKYMFSSFI
jgi:hypothetical protein